MTERSRTYNEQVSVYGKANQLIGKALFVGKAWQKRKYGPWRWNGILIKTEFDAAVLGGKTITIVFVDGARGNASCSSSGTNKPGLVDVEGVGRPPNVGHSQ